MPDHGWNFLSVPKYAWKWLNKVLTMPEFSICLIILYTQEGFEYASDIKYARVLNMLWYSYNNNIIIVTNAIILEFLLFQFVHQGALQLTILSFLTEVRT